MKTATGWEVYLKIKAMSEQQDAGHEIHIDDVTAALEIDPDTIREYLTALALLDFIEFTDDSKNTFIITDLGR